MAAKPSKKPVAKIKPKGDFVTPYKQITDAILADLNAGVAPWAKPWGNAGATVSIASGFPVNFTTRKAYRGVNVWMALLACQANGWRVPAFGTFRQITEAGGKVRKGSKATRIFYMTTIEREPKTAEEAAKVNENGMFVRFVLKGYSVFNIAQVEGIELEADVMAVEPSVPTDTAELVDALEARVRHDSPEAYYQPDADFIAMPNPQSFNGIEHYKATLFHELTHWTGADHRLTGDPISQVRDAVRLVRHGRNWINERKAPPIAAMNGDEIAAALAALGYAGAWAKCPHKPTLRTWLDKRLPEQEAFPCIVVTTGHALAVSGSTVCDSATGGEVVEADEAEGCRKRVVRVFVVSHRIEPQAIPSKPTRAGDPWPARFRKLVSEAGATHRLERDRFSAFDTLEVAFPDGRTLFLRHEPGDWWEDHTTLERFLTNPNAEQFEAAGNGQFYASR